MKMDVDARKACNMTYLRPFYCNDTHSNVNACDPYYNNHKPKVVKGIRGLTSGVIHGSLSLHKTYYSYVRF